MYHIPLQSKLLGFLGFDNFGMAALYYQKGSWEIPFTASFQKISTVLDQAQEPMGLWLV